MSFPPASILPRGSTEPQPRSSPSIPSESSQSQPPPGSGRGSSKIIEFVDSQDPNVKSAIQRHTAYHSAAQRRNARLRSIRGGNESRYLEWRRRPPTADQSTTSTTIRSRSDSVSPESSLTGTEKPATFGPSGGESIVQGMSESQSPNVTTNNLNEASVVQLGLSEEAVLQWYPSTACEHANAPDFFSAALSYMRTDDACTYLLIAYAYAIQASQVVAEDGERDRRSAQLYFGRGTNILWNRLRDSSTASSDANIQAVLLLIVYTSDFGQTDEVQIHRDALNTMIEQRGGVGQFVENLTLQRQLLSIETSRKYHLTLDCTVGCPTPFRFPPSAWSQRLRSRE